MSERFDPDAKTFGFDKQGKPISVRDYERLHTPEYLRVAEDTIHTPFGDVWVSTVWLGLDYSFTRFMPGGDKHPPIIFETMVFNHGSDPRLVSPYDIFDVQDRYATEAAALAGHDQIVMMIRDTIAAHEPKLDLTKHDTERE